MQRFTSVFGMGTGGSTALWTPGKLVSHKMVDSSDFEVNANKYIVSVLSALRLFWRYMVKPHGSLVLVSYTHYCASTPSLSTLWSSTAL